MYTVTSLCSCVTRYVEYPPSVNKLHYFQLFMCYFGATIQSVYYEFGKYAH